MYEVIYLTGAAAAGKSTLSRTVSASPAFAVFEYGQELLNQASGSRLGLTHADTRRDPQKIIKPEHVAATDEALQLFIRAHRDSRHVVIDSHAVSKEPYGFRIEPFGPGQLQRAALSRIVVLRCAPEILVRRTRDAPDGRPAVTLSEADEYQSFQATVAISYAIILGVPIHFLNSATPPAELYEQFLHLIGSPSH